MFIDRARVKTVGGDGGNGCCSFRREKYVPRGGPDGGDGGDGGNVVFVAERRLNSLLDLQYHAVWKAGRGQHGQGKGCHGRTGETVEVAVPVGTVVHDFDSGDALADLAEEGARFVAATGGSGGKGNARFASSTNQAPRFAELGEPGQVREYLLELKLIAEVGLVGLPNAGKSTLLATVSAATPKIADYPFTTLSPNLGVARLSGYRTLTIADIPGIIEGAAEGKGLGHDFLRHIERTQVLLFMVDLGDPDPAETLAVLEDELKRHSPVFATRPKVVALNKADLPENREMYELLRGHFSGAFLISAATGEGLPELLEHLWQCVDRVKRDVAPPEETAHEYVYEAPYEIRPTKTGFRIVGDNVVRALRMTNFDNEEAVRHFQHKLKRMGVLKALKRMGAQPGQPVFIDDVELEYQPEE